MEAQVSVAIIEILLPIRFGVKEADGHMTQRHGTQEACGGATDAGCTQHRAHKVEIDLLINNLPRQASDILWGHMSCVLA